MALPTCEYLDAGHVSRLIQRVQAGCAIQHIRSPATLRVTFDIEPDFAIQFFEGHGVDELCAPFAAIVTVACN